MIISLLNVILFKRAIYSLPQEDLKIALRQHQDLARTSPIYYARNVPEIR